MWLEVSMPTDVTRALDFIILDILAVSCGLGYRVMNKNHGMPAAIVETLQPHITELLSEIIEHSGVFRQNIVNFWKRDLNKSSVTVVRGLEHRMKREYTCSHLVVHFEKNRSGQTEWEPAFFSFG